ncbi:hypothetical protein CANMA_001825 [Candida margitis]|uniref:uncharacterized protein n=1 Tax=Candida margitis TaxID=1775924 RepID=UPI002227EBB7|nr:uncharacterized protein CANMA_001825 [Candida margitis]KAI5969158.1 hypothetical protein CANMA_001825 [Candida margitis]
MDEILSSKRTQLVELINTVIGKEFDAYGEDYYANAFTSYKDATIDQLSLDEAQFKFEEPDDLSEAEIEKFNETVSSKLKETLLNTSFQKVLLSLIEEHIKSENSHLIGKLALTLDYLLWLALEVDRSTKLSFYYCLEVVSNQLFSISTNKVECFWSYVESRLPIIQSQLFENSFAERISILSLGNSLTDRYNTSITGIQTDSTMKDTINDRFQFRVRMFMTELLAIDDNTGLNKYFHTHNVIPPHIETKDVFISDVLEIQKMFNDPLYYLRKSNVMNFTKMTEKLYRVYGQLVEEELRFRKKNPLPEQFSFLEPKSEPEKEYLHQKYLHREYVPESYLESNFGKESKSEQSQNTDYKFLYHRMEISKVRMQYLLMIYILSVFYVELTPSSKSEFMESIGAPTTTKHITEDFPPIGAVKKYTEIKTELSTVLKKIDPSLSFLFIHLSLDEKIWWKWLLHGKDEKNEGFFVDKILKPEILAAREDAFKNLYPYKNKRSFNTYVTPQVSKKMRTERGLEKLEQAAKFDSEKATEELSSVEKELESGSNDELRDKKSSYSWKLLRWKRNV